MPLSDNEFIDDRKKRGYSDQQIISELVQSGWTKDQAQELVYSKSEVVLPQSDDYGLTNKNIGYRLGSRAFKLFRKKLLPLFLIIIFSFGIGFGFNYLFSLLLDKNLDDEVSSKIIIYIGQISIYILSTFVSLILSYLTILIIKHPRVELINFLEKSLVRIVGFWLLGMAVGLIFYGGLIAFIVPGIILILILFQSSYIFIGEEVGVKEAIKISYLYSYGHKKRIALLFLPIVGIILLYIVLFASGLLSLTMGYYQLTGLYEPEFSFFLILLFMGIAVFFISPFVMCYMYLLAEDLAEKYKEGSVPEKKFSRFKKASVVFLVIAIVIPLGTIIFLNSPIYKNILAKQEMEQEIEGDRLMSMSSVITALNDYYRTESIFPPDLNIVEDKYHESIAEWSTIDYPAELSIFEYSLDASKKDYKLCVPYEAKDEYDEWLETEPGKHCETRKNELVGDEYTRAWNIVSITKALDFYYSKYNSYPKKLLDLIDGYDKSDCESKYNCPLVGYLEFEDPKTYDFYEYSTSVDRQSYTLCYTSELQSKEICKEGSSGK